ncbi:hypothetical protein IAT38_000499 [Cryptococcus sp. DSM 104549]
MDPECSPLKHRYDTCFNQWFEGYLQPALDSVRSTSYAPPPISTPAAAPAASASASTSTSPQAPPQAQPTPASPRHVKQPLITSWAAAFPTRPRTRPAHHGHHHHHHSHPAPGQASTGEAEEIDYPDDDDDEEEMEPIDTAGKTRAQIKAEEYDRNCGKVWAEYQGCLKKAIAKDENLSQLLDQAREEHPLRGLDKLSGTPWDPNTKMTDS